MNLNFIALLVAILIALTGSPAAAREAESSSQPAASVEAEERKKVLVMIRQAPNRLRPGASYSSGYGSAQSRAVRERLGRQIARQYDFEFVELWPMPLIGLDCFVLRLKNEQTALQAVEMLEQHPSVQWAEPMEVYETLAQRRADRADPLAALSPASKNWEISRVHSSWIGRNVDIAVIDTQVDANHPDLRGRIRLARNFAPQSPARPEFHGTEVAGIIAANARDGIGIAGVAPGARIMALRACWQRGTSRRSACTSLNLARAVNFAIERGAKVINLSLGGPPNQLLSQLIDAANARGIAVVAAYNPSLPMGGFPASHSDVIAVSQEGVTIGKGYVAPGMDIPTTQPGGGWNFVSGSSYSAAHVSGLLALNYERSQTRRGAWRSLARASGNSREIDIAATFR